MIEVAAIIYSIFVTVVVLFQFALALGAPWGEYAMGGTHPGKYPMKLRVAAIVQGVLMAITALVVLWEVYSLWPEWTSATGVAIWFVVALMAVSTILNLITKSKWERRIWAPVTVILLITSLVVALG